MLLLRGTLSHVYVAIHVCVCVIFRFHRGEEGSRGV